MGVKDGIVRVQGDRLADLLGLPHNTYFKREELERITKTNFGDTVMINSKSVKVTFKIKGLASILIGKI